MAYLGHYGDLDFMQAGDTIFVWVAGRWCKYIDVQRWFSSTAGRVINRVRWAGRWVSLKVAR